MAKEKLTLNDLKVESSVTTLGEEQLGKVKGGYYIVKGHVYTYTSRWTTIDIRGDNTVGGNVLPGGIKH
jgi:hypothetical protein